MDIFRELAVILQLQHEKQWSRAARAIEKHTLNVRWRDELAQRSDGAIEPNEPWCLAAIEEFDQRLQELRATQSSVAVSSGESAATQVAEGLMAQGRLFVAQGSYRDAQLCFQASRSSSGHNFMGAVLSSHLDVLQHNWSTVETSVGKLLPELSDRPWPSEYAMELRANYGLAAWMLGDYADSTAALLGLDLGSLAGPDSKENCSGSNEAPVWLSRDIIANLVSLGAVASLSRANLQVLIRDDGVAGSADLVRAFLAMDIPSFLKLLTSAEEKLDNHMFLSKALGPLRARIKRRLCQTYLGMYFKCRLSTFLRLFGYSVLEFTHDVRLWKLPLIIDAVEDVIEWQTESTPNFEGEGGKDLTSLFERDALMLLWHSQTAFY